MTRGLWRRIPGEPGPGANPRIRAVPVHRSSAAVLAGRAWPTRRPIPLLVRRAFLLFVATIPFEPIPLPGLLGAVTLARLAGVLFFVACLWYPKTCFPLPAPAVLWFSGYLAVFLLLGMFVPSELRGQLLLRFSRMAQLVVLFWVGSSLLQETRLARQTLFTFGVATAALAVANILGVQGFAVTMKAGGATKGTRETALGYNPNGLGAVLALAAIMLIGLLLDNTRRTRAKAWLLACLTAPLLALLVATGSRGALLSFVLGASLFLIPLTPSRRRIAGFALGGFALIALAVMLARNPTSLARWTETINKGNVAGRDVIFGNTFQMFLERPILGWGPVEFLYELGSRQNRRILDPHNVIMWLLLEVGIVGAVFFFAGLWLCARAAWKSRTGPEGILPLALIVVVTIMSQSGSHHAKKPMWLVLAIALASPVISANWKRTVSLGIGRVTRSL